MGKPLRGIGAACALTLGALVGIVMPLGDAQIATAQAVVQDQASPEQTTQQNAPATEQQTPATPGTETTPGTDTSTEPTETSATEPVPEVSTDAQPEPQGTEPAAPAKPRPQFAAPFAAAASNTLSCETGSVYSVSTTGQLGLVKIGSNNGVSFSPVGTKARNVAEFNGLGISSDGTTAFAYERKNKWGEGITSIYRFDAATGVWTGLKDSGVDSDDAIVGGAVDKDGTFWIGAFTTDGSEMHLWALKSGTSTPERRGTVKLPKIDRKVAGTGANGDMAFDAAGNLYIVRGSKVEEGSRWPYTKVDKLLVSRVDAEKLPGTQSVASIDPKATVYNGNSPIEYVNGVAYDSNGRLYLGGGKGGFGFVLVGGASQVTKLSGVSGDWTTDLATCSFPPTVKIQKELPNGRIIPTDQFELELNTGSTVLGTAETAGAATGIQPEAVGPIPVAAETSFTFSERPANATTVLNQYSSSWDCFVGKTQVAFGSGTSGNYKLLPAHAGKEVTCTIRNTIPTATKTATPASGQAVSENQVVRYTLSFDNRSGATPVNISYRDYLADVLDDAVFVDNNGNARNPQSPLVDPKNGMTYVESQDWNASKQWINVRGTVPAGEIGTLSFPVKVLPNATRAEAREGSVATQGFFLRNKLARGSSETPPTTCEPGLCVEHPINAWTVTKDSSPANGARLHKGGNVHYTVTATKLTDTTQLNGLVLTDDLTHVFKTAGWAPGAAVPGGKIGGGVYLLDKDGYSLDANGVQNSGDKSSPKAIRTLAELTPKNVSSDGATPKWLLTTGEPLNVPSNAKKVELRFAVQAAESPADIPNASQWAGPGKAPSTGWKFVNYATGIAKNSQDKVFAPNACITGTDVPDTSAAPDAKDQGNPNFPAQCKRTHELSQNYFTIRKDAAGVGVSSMADDSWDPDPYGLWNMVGHKFQVRDDINGVPSTYPSVKLCRTDYNPNTWDGKWVTPEKAAVEANWDFSSEKSVTRAAILDWNNKNPDKKLPECGTLYEITSGNKDKPAGQEGRWRSENLSDGKYWLVETQAPNGQRSEDGQNYRPVAGVQRLAAPIPFTIWPDDESKDGVADHGRGQLDVLNGDNGYVARCNPGRYDSNGDFKPGDQLDKRPTACVNPTGYLMLVRDPAPAPLPLTGGMGPWALWGGGSAALIAAAVGTIWWRSRRADGTRQLGARHSG